MRSGLRHTHEGEHHVHYVRGRLPRRPCLRAVRTSDRQPRLVAEGLARAPLVRSASTTGAKLAAGVLAMHAVPIGAVASKLAAVPASMNAVIMLTNPWIARAAVGVVTLSAMDIAADAAIGRMQRTLRVRPAPSRDDRRLFTQAARQALIAEAKRRRNEQEPQAARQLVRGSSRKGRPPSEPFLRFRLTLMGGRDWRGC